MGPALLKVEVHTRKTLQPDCTERETSYVACPLTGSSRPVQACRECGHSTGIERDSDGHWFVVCRANAPEVAPINQLRVPPGWEAIPVTEVMTPDPHCIHQDVAVAEVLTLLVEHGISGAPVVDDAGRPMGMVSQTDLMMEEYEEVMEDDTSPSGAARTVRARDIMTPGAVSIHDRGTLIEAIRLMATKGVHRLPVVDSEGAVVGIVSTLDVVAALASKAREGVGELAP